MPESRNHEIHRIQCQNYENHEHLIIPRQNQKIMKFLEFNAIIMKNNKT